MNGRGRAVRGALAVLLSLAGSASPGSGGEEKATFDVSVTVTSGTRLARVEQPAAVTVTPEDARRGYAEVPIPSRLAVHSNARDGYLLVVDVPADWVSQVLIRGLPTEAQVSSPGGWLLQPHPGGLRHELDLRFRFQLRPGTRPGTYPWPVRLAVRPRVH